VETGVLRGVLIVESVRVGGRIAVPVHVTALTRFAAPPEPIGGPPTWTFLEFEAELEQAEQLMFEFASALDDTHAWYASFRSNEEMFVVFSGRRFRYKLGDAAARGEVETYARSIGVPESQLDWEQ